MLGQLAPSDPEDDVELAEKRMLLHALGLHAMPAALPMAGILAAGRRVALTAGEGELDELLLRIDSCTAWGRRRQELDEDDRWLAELLAGFAANSFRNYDLLGACRVLRTLSRLAPSNDTLVMRYVRHLVLQQRPSGAFGFFGTEVGQLKRDLGESFSPTVGLYLPVALEAVWTLGECLGQGWSLYWALLEAARPLNVSSQ